jgi:type I restriction enzyme S subunit
MKERQRAKAAALPMGWRAVRFIDLCKLQRGYDLPLKSITAGNYPVVTSSGVHGYHNEYRASGPCLITGRSGGVGNIHYLDVAEYWPHNTVLFVKDFCGNYPKYLYYYFLQFNFRGFSASTTIPTLDRKQLFNETVYLPPLAEQHRIVAKIEELFSSLDKGIEDLKTAQQQLKVYRQAVLKWAFEGKLTNRNVVDGEVPRGWRNKPISEIVQTLEQGWSPKCETEPSHDEDRWAVIKTTAVQPGFFVESENKALPKTLEPRKQHELLPGDVLITRAGPRSRAGVCCIVKHVRPHLMNCDKVYRIRVKGDQVTPDFFGMALGSPNYFDRIEEMKTGISDSGVNLTQKGFLEITIEVPSLAEQQLIVSEIESRLSVCDKIEETITDSLKQAESLRQSILKKAFEGKLVHWDPNDEPASVLLARIKAERENNGIGAPRSRRGKSEVHGGVS